MEVEAEAGEAVFLPLEGGRAPHTCSSHVVQKQTLRKPEPRAEDWLSWLALTVGPNLPVPKADDSAGAARPSAPSGHGG